MHPSAAAAPPAQPPDFGRVCAIVVTLNIGPAIHACVKAAQDQVQHIVFIDNASEDGTRRELEAIRAQHPDFIDILENHDGNLGRAQNLGFLLASDLGFEWALLLDHDSLPAPGMVAAMKKTYLGYPEPSRIGLLAPHFIDESSGKRPRFIAPLFWLLFRPLDIDAAPYVEPVQTAISSGSLVRLSAVGEVGMMDEGFYIDYIDKDFCLRLNAAGWRILAVRDAILKHRLGSGERKGLLGMGVCTTNHSAERYYYIYRNRLITWKRFFRRIPSYVLYDKFALLFDLLRVSLFDAAPGAKLRAMGRGLVDGVKGVTGKRA